MATDHESDYPRPENSPTSTMGTLYRTLTGQSQQSASEADPSMHHTVTNSSSTDPLAGTLNHLTPKQEEALDKFKARLEKEGWWRRESANGKASHDDGTLLRYLRARKFNVDGAVGQFTDTERWMKEQRVEELYEHFDVDFYEKARTMYPQWTGRRDRRGIPLYVYVIKHLDSKNVAKYEKESKTYKAGLPNHKNLPTPAKLLPLFALYHNLLNFVLPMVSTLERPNPEIPVTNSTNIVDISHVGLSQFWNLKAHMQDASVLATAHYPETLDRIFIIGAPGFFPTVWGWIKRWFDPVTVSKIFILGKNDVKSTLSSFIEPENFPQRYGGSLKWEFGDLPMPDKAATAALESDGSHGWIRGPCLWLEHKRVVVGSEQGKLRRSDKEVAELKPVVYAADYTEEPVHPDRRGSIASHKRQSMTVPPNHAEHANGAALGKQNVVARQAAAPEKQATESGAATAAVTTATAVVTAEVGHRPKQDVDALYAADPSIRKAPVDGAAVRIPDHQPAPPAQTLEYVSSTSSRPTSPPQPGLAASPAADTPAHPANPQPSTQASSLTSPPPSTTSTTSATSAPPTSAPPPPPGVPLPGPLTTHHASMYATVASKLEGESVSVIPESANGVLPHPEIITASDRSKGLAIESDKLAVLDAARKSIDGKRGEKPKLERFVTAAEF